MIWFLAATLALAPTYLIRFKVFGIPTTFLEILIVVFLLSAAINFNAKDFEKIKKLGRINWAIGLFMLAGIISVAVSPQMSSALGQFKAYIIEPILVFYTSVLVLKNKKQLLPVFQMLFWSTVIVSLFGIFQYFSFIHLPIRFWGNGNEVTRIVSIFEYPNALSLFLGPLLGFFSTLWFYNLPLTKNKWISAIGLLITALALLLTFSRGAWIAITIGLLFILSKRFGFKQVVLPIIIAGLALLMIPGIRNRLGLGLSDPSSSAHFELIKIGVNKIISNPIFGNGLYGFRTTQIEANSQIEILNYPHNIFLNFWLELGLLGLISFIWILILIYRKFVKEKQQPIILAAGVYIMIVLMHGLVDVPYFKNDLSLLFWFIASLFFL